MMLMKTLAKTDTDVLRDLFDLPDPIVSVYFGMEDPVGDDIELRRRAIRHDLLRTAAGRTALDGVERALKEVPLGSGMIAAFVGRDGEAQRFDMPEADLTDHAHRSSLPSVVPLLDWRQHRPAYVLVVLDRAGAEMTVQPPGAEGAVRTTLPGPDDEIVRNAPGGPSQMRYQHRAEDSWLHNSGHAAVAAAEALASSGAGLLIVAGDVRAVQFFRDKLPTWVHQQIHIESVSARRNPDGSEKHRGTQITQAARKFVDERVRQTVSSVLDQSGPDGLGVHGVAATIRALARGQVHQLLVAPAPQPGVAWFGPAPTDISVHRSGISSPDSEVKHGPLIDVLIRAAVLTDADVTLLPEETASGLDQSVGAICRFAIP